MVDILNFLIRVVADLVGAILALLPNSPFSWDFGAFSPYIKVINYFIPFQAMATMAGAYVVAVGVWYALRWLLRIARYIG